MALNPFDDQQQQQQMDELLKHYTLNTQTDPAPAPTDNPYDFGSAPAMGPTAFATPRFPTPSQTTPAPTTPAPRRGAPAPPTTPAAPAPAQATDPASVQALLDAYVKSTSATSPIPAATLPGGGLNHDWIKSFITNNFGNGVNKPTSASIDNIIQSLAHIGVHAVRATHAGGIPSDDKIVFDDGTMFDLISDVGGPNAQWTYSQVGGGNSGGGGGGGSFPTSTAGINVALPPGQFDDATTKYLEDFIQGRLTELNAPVNDPARNQLAELLQAQIKRYGEQAQTQEGINAGLRTKQAAAGTSAGELVNYLKSTAGGLSSLPPEVQAAYDRMTAGANARIQDLSQLPQEWQNALNVYRTGTSTRIQDLQNLPPELKQALDGYISSASGRASELQSLPPELQAALTDLMSQTNSRMASLKEPAYTGTEQEILRTQALDPIEADRQAAKQRDRARVSDSGMLPSSGVALALENATDQSYDRQRNVAQGDIAAKQIAERRNRDAEIQRLAEGLFGTRADVSGVGEARKTQAQQLRDQILGVQQGASALGESRKTDAQGLLTELTGAEKNAALYSDSRKDQAQGLRSGLMDAATAKTATDDARKLKAGELLSSIPGIQRDTVTSDLNLENQLQDAISRITQSQIAAAGSRAGLNNEIRADETTRRQEALALASMLQQLPTQAMQQAMAAIGQAPNPESMINQLITLFGIGQTTRAQNAGYYGALAQSIPYLANSFKPSGTSRQSAALQMGGV